MTAAVKVWDPMVRIFHWGLATSFVVAWVTGDEWDALHHWAGYAAAGLIAFRLIWGVIGSRYARFTQFIQSPSKTIAYLKDIVTGRENRYLGHNPAGAAMILALLAAMAGCALTGWMYTTDAYWGVNWVEQTHKFLANALLALVLLHLGGVLLASMRHHENLIRAMITGRKRRPGHGDIS
ncbi:cytochrome b/b6 domain-containing protein [Thalassospira alkalitolerans]|uniref:Cytochrome B561 n=1 Tax=Thalassospira alkalitolerans TaxID=1293890 RepID=A0A1Y2LBT7_9PROT|nr:cytochrome b/b6 domain-containing protein [Thalassospira alkalitolerans]OSQ48286.1 cytochrome B561 [Thalassospira alkalitolerans]|tara:strand:+ start:38893 stop:39432 length:540 start_codon:yes stop_codon:yes gene_type:complete